MMSKINAITGRCKALNKTPVIQMQCKQGLWLIVMVNVFNSWIQEPEAGWLLWVWGHPQLAQQISDHPRLCSETIFQNQNNNHISNKLKNIMQYNQVGIFHTNNKWNNKKAISTERIKLCTHRHIHICTHLAKYNKI